MHDVEYNKKQVWKYLIWVFALAYAIQVGAAFIANSGHLVLGRVIIAGMMFVPMLSVLLAGGSLRGMGWDPQLKRNWKLLLAAWLAPAVLTLVGAVLYFLVFPKHFDLSGSYLTAAAGEEVLAQLQAQGLTYPLYVVITAVASVTYAPVITAVEASSTPDNGFLSLRKSRTFIQLRSC